MILKKLSNRIFLVLFILGIIGTLPEAFASNKFSPIPDDLKYTSQSEKISLSADETKEYEKISDALASLDLPALQNGGAKGSLLGVDEVFWNIDSGKAALLKLNVAPTDDSLQNKILKDDDSYLYHSKTKSGLGFALYFVNTPAESVEAAVNLLQKSLANNDSKVSRASWLIPSAEAQPAGFHKGGPLYNSKRPQRTDHGSSAESAEQTPTAVNVNKKAENFARDLLACGKGLGSGIYDSTIGYAIKVGKGAIRLVQSTAWALSNPKQAWQKTKQRFNDFTNLVKTATEYSAYRVGLGRGKDKIEGMKQGLADSKSKKADLSELPPKPLSFFEKLSVPERVKFVCHLTAKLGVAGASMLFAPGYGLALSHELALFFSIKGYVSSAESGRVFFMEAQFAEVNKRYGEHHKRLKKEQIEKSRRWARENPQEAAKIIARYQ